MDLMEMQLEKLVVLEEGDNPSKVGPMMACCFATFTFMI